MAKAFVHLTENYYETLDDQHNPQLFTCDKPNIRKLLRKKDSLDFLNNEYQQYYQQIDQNNNYYFNKIFKSLLIGFSSLCYSLVFFTISFFGLATELPALAFSIIGTASFGNIYRLTNKNAQSLIPFKNALEEIVKIKEEVITSEEEPSNDHPQEITTPELVQNIDNDHADSQEHSDFTFIPLDNSQLNMYRDRINQAYNSQINNSNIPIDYKPKRLKRTI